MLVTQARLRSVYAMLSAMPPFNRWALPAAGTVRFYLVNKPATDGEYNVDDKGRHSIGINSDRCHTLIHLTRTMAHEMVHMRQELIGKRPATKDEQHNREFYRLARLVCRDLGFESEGF